MTIAKFGHFVDYAFHCLSILSFGHFFKEALNSHEPLLGGLFGFHCWCPTSGALKKHYAFVISSSFVMSTGRKAITHANNNLCLSSLPWSSIKEHFFAWERKKRGPHGTFAYCLRLEPALGTDLWDILSVAPYTWPSNVTLPQKDLSMALLLTGLNAIGRSRVEP